MADNDKHDGKAVKEFDAAAEVARVRDEIMAAPEPGTDPDSQRRLAKTLAAVNTYPADTEEEAAQDVSGNDSESDENETKETAAAKRKAATPTRTTAPQGRSAAPTQKAD